MLEINLNPAKIQSVGSDLQYEKLEIPIKLNDKKEEIKVE